MRVRPRVVLASLLVSLLVYVTACGLAYDVDSLSSHYPPCGTVGKRCCAGDTCSDHLACVAQAPDGGAAAPESGACHCSSSDASLADGASETAGSGGACECGPRACERCGNPGEACCPLETGQQCNANTPLTCDANGRCTGCGVHPGDPCCPGLVECSIELGLSCGPQGTCVAKTACGGSGQACCGNGATPCNAGLTCGTQGRCESPSTTCGAEGQSCCGNGATPCDTGLTCNTQGTCQAPSTQCGASGQACCTSGAECGQSNLKCISGSCQPCGDTGQPCCDNPQCVDLTRLTCLNGSCTSCGQEGQVPCSGNCSDPSLRVGDDGLCHACPSRNSWCRSDPSSGQICLGTGGTEQCAACGTQGQYCCPSGSACDSKPVCCEGGPGSTGCGQACNTTAADCSCKVCCVLCNGGQWQSVHAAPGDCGPVAASTCGGASKVYNNYFKAGGCP